MDGWVSEWIDRLIGGCMDRLVWMDGWMDRLMIDETF